MKTVGKRLMQLRSIQIRIMLVIKVGGAHLLIIPHFISDKGMMSILD